MLSSSPRVALGVAVLAVAVGCTACARGNDVDTTGVPDAMVRDAAALRDSSGLFVMPEAESATQNGSLVDTA